MLCVQAHHDIKHARLFGRERAIRAQHGKDGLRRALTWNETMHDHRIAVEIRLLRMVGEHHDALQTRDERNSCFDLMLDGTIFGVGVVCIERDDRTRQHDHQVRCRMAHDTCGREAIGQFALCIDSSHELVEFVLRRKFAEHEQVRDLFKTIALAG